MGCGSVVQSVGKGMEEPPDWDGGTRGSRRQGGGCLLGLDKARLL